MTPGLVKSLIKRFIGMVGGEAMQSAFHFGLNLALVQMMAAHDYGVFAIIMIIGGIGLTYIRAFCAMPVSICIGRSRSARAANAYDVTFGSGALLLAGGLGLATAVLLQGWIGAQGLLGGLFVGLWSVRSYMRTSMFALGHQRAITIADAVFTLSGCILALCTLRPDNSDKLQTVLAVLVVANACGLLAVLLLVRRKLRFSFGRQVQRRYRALWMQLGWSGISVTTANLQGQALAMLVAGMAGPAAYAPIAAGFVLFVPLRIIATALVNLMQPLLAGHVSRGETGRMWQQALAWTGLMAMGSIAYALGMSLALPYLKLKVFEGAPVYIIWVCCWAVYTATMLCVMPHLILEAANAFRQIAMVTGKGAVVGMALVALCLMLAPPAFAPLGALVSELYVLWTCWILVVRMFPYHQRLAGPTVSPALPTVKS